MVIVRVRVLYGWRYTASLFVLETRPLRLTIRNFIFQPNTCGYSPYVTSSLTRGWICRLQVLLVLASAVIIRSESRGTHNYILKSQIQDSPNMEGQAPDLSHPETGWTGYTPRQWVPFSSSPMYRRATVEVFDPAFPRDTLLLDSSLLLNNPL
jgi:hypothetical protein